MIEAVSYTHLDVYKRQLFTLAKNLQMNNELFFIIIINNKIKLNDFGMLYV